MLGMVALVGGWFGGGGEAEGDVGVALFAEFEGDLMAVGESGDGFRVGAAVDGDVEAWLKVLQGFDGDGEFAGVDLIANEEEEFFDEGEGWWVGGEFAGVLAEGDGDAEVLRVLGFEELVEGVSDADGWWGFGGFRRFGEQVMGEDGEDFV